MTQRSRARRRKGSYRQERSQVERSPRPADETADDYAQRTIDYWKRAEPRPLFVYFIRECQGPIKIGKASDPVARLTELQCGNPRSLWLEAVILAGPTTERELHRRWHDFAWVRGEWFDGGYTDVIAALAQETAQRQIIAHRAGESMSVITQYLVEDIWPAEPSTYLGTGYMGYASVEDFWAAQDLDEVAA